MLTYSPLNQATDDELRHLANLIYAIEQERLREKYKHRPIADDACFLIPDKVPAEILNRCPVAKGGYCLIQRMSSGWIAYLNESGIWEEVSDRAATRHRTYSSLASAMGGKKWQAGKGEQSEVAVWLHPEAEWPERDKYLLMSGLQYQSSPTQ